VNASSPYLPDAYAAALREYLGDPGEAGRARAYELGRQALAAGVSVVDLAAAHAQGLAAAVAATTAAEERGRLAQRAAEFLGETLAPSEMMLRGYRQANDALQRLNETLEQRVRERTAALKEADRRKDEFLAMLAHELRNPLAPIRNALHVMQLAGDDVRALTEVRDMMERQVCHLVRLVDDLMDVSRISRGKIELRKQRLDVAAAVRNALEIARPLVEAAGHEVTLALPSEPLVVEADPARLVQVVANLLNNASKYTEPGGRIWLSAARDAGHAVVRVQDTGIGIPTEMLPHVFDMFVQVDAAVSRSQGGLGIGLTLVKRLVELHGGSVEAASGGPGLGSEFIVRLPLAVESGAAPRADTPGPEARPAPQLSTLRVLVVDDNRDAAESLALLMRLAGHQVQVALDGREALESARAFQPRILLQDIEMPGMSGYEVARRIREQATDVLLVAVTGYGSEEARHRSREAGFDHHLVKPVDFATLQQVLASVTLQA
jgi:signal transduction histidine kinase